MLKEVMGYLSGRAPVYAYFVYDGRVPFAYIQKWRAVDFPDYKPYVPLHRESTGIDVHIGVRSYLHRGWGPRVIRAFLAEHVFSNLRVPEAIIDPLPENRAAIRAYEKVGFVHEKTFQHDGVGVYFMRLPREQFDTT